MSRYIMFMILFFFMFFSFTSASASHHHVVIADFSLGVDNNGIPTGWQLKEKTGKANVSIIRDGNIDALRLRSSGTSFALQKPLDLNIQEYPLLSWDWKVIKLPAGGDFRISRTDDQAAQLFIAFSNHKAIAYIWDTNAPRGLIGDTWAPPFMKIKAVVVRSGPTDTGKWISEMRNAYEDYRIIFGHEPPHVSGVRIQINSQHTATQGESLFSNVRFKKS